jgi:DNA processing protein
LEQGREVFAIPGSIHSPLAKGCHQLIRQGAKLVESAQDILEELNPLVHASPAQSIAETTDSPVPMPALPNSSKEQRDRAPSSATDTDPTSRKIMNAVAHDPASVDQLAERTGLSAADIQAALLRLELDGKIERMQDGRFQRLG